MFHNRFWLASSWHYGFAGLGVLPEGEHHGVKVGDERQNFFSRGQLSVAFRERRLAVHSSDRRSRCAGAPTPACGAFRHIWEGWKNCEAENTYNLNGKCINVVYRPAHVSEFWRQRSCFSTYACDQANSLICRSFAIWGLEENRKISLILFSVWWLQIGMK